VTRPATLEELDAALTEAGKRLAAARRDGNFEAIIVWQASVNRLLDWRNNLIAAR
jgi:hypothetical protein